MEAIFSFRQLMKKYQEKRKNLHRLEESYGREPIGLFWWVLDKRNVVRGYIEYGIIRDMYKGAMTSLLWRDK